MKPEKQLYQWDVNQYLTGINPAAQYVDYTIGNEVIRLETDGTRCRIPDEVMQTYGGKTCYERYPDGTFRAYSFTVLYAPKPPDYVFTPEERTTFEALTARVDAAIDEIKRRADSGEFTPVKGVDYFTDAEKNEMMESVSSGAVGEFRKVVDTATTEYNANASEKLTTYDTNAEQHTSDYNSNAEQKLESYNQNHTEKVAEYNQNAETKTAEFDANAAALQTELDRLRGECDQLAEENRKQENRIDALMKLNKGQTYDIVPEEGETTSRTAPSGAKYVSVDMVGGKSVVWNQFVKQRESPLTSNGVTSTYNTDGTVTLSGTVTSDYAETYSSINLAANHVYLYRNIILANPNNISFLLQPLNLPIVRPIVKNTSNSSRTNYGISRVTSGTDLTGIKFKSNFFDLTQMFGSTIADYIYSLEQSQAGAGVAWFKKLFPADYYPYCEPTIISSHTDRVDVASADGTVTQQIITSFPVLNSAGSVYDYIDLNEGKLHQRVGVVDLGTLTWETDLSNRFRAQLSGIKNPTTASERQNGLVCVRYSPSSNVSLTDMIDKSMLKYSGEIFIKDAAYTDAQTFKTAMNGVMLYYELADEVITDIDIPTELTEWLPVEPGGTVTFENADESKQLPVPNAVNWVRKLDEVE